ncbi:MAG: hypothetical protein HOP30_04690 [Cyclobacteriaceae bacterium]|nr:hypothetical protein [Cyclobacteriaceae bacterium]
MGHLYQRYEGEFSNLEFPTFQKEPYIRLNKTQLCMAKKAKKASKKAAKKKKPPVKKKK